jgi:chorismate synthase
MTRLRWSTAGESHGPKLSVWVEGVPAGLSLTKLMIDADLARRQQGYGRGGRMKIEQDEVEIHGGVRLGETLGSPIAMTIVNRDYAHAWEDRMSPAPGAASPSYVPVTRPRPGHADLAGGLKYDRKDLRDVLERASARETAARTAAGAVARQLLHALGISIFAHVRSIGTVHAKVDHLALEELRVKALASDLWCADEAATLAMREAIHAASHAGDTLGGVFEVVALGVPVGLGSYVHWDRRLDGRLAQALMSIHAIKGIEIGNGFENATRRGSEVHDPIVYAGDGFSRSQNRAGGVEGGISTGEALVCRAAMKPISTVRKGLPSVDIVTKQAETSAYERSDICAVAAASVVGEAMVALVLAEAMLEKFGGDSMRELLRNVETYRDQLCHY